MQERESSTGDYEVISEILNGNKNRYEVLIRKYNQRLYRIAKGIITEDEQVEDAMQEAYVKAYNNLGKFEKRSSFSTWLTRILINECLMIKRQENKLFRLDDEREETSFPDYLTPENISVNKELRTMLEYAISSLPEKYRVVFIMREVEELSVAETSEGLDITETNVKARLSRAKEMLRENLTAAMPATQLLEFNLKRCDKVLEHVMSRI